MEPEPVYEKEKPYQKLAGKVAIITGGDSGIGRAVAIAFVKEGASVCIAYHKDHRDAKETAHRIEELGGNCLLLAGDISDEKPTAFDFKALFKYEAWAAVKGKSKEQAIQEYIALVNTLHTQYK